MIVTHPPWGGYMELYCFLSPCQDGYREVMD
jgi:hypothetical protein